MANLASTAGNATRAPSSMQDTGGYQRIRIPLLTALLAICILVGLVVKVITFHAAWKQRQRHLALSWLVMSLMVAGLIHMLLVVPFEITEVAHPTWIFGEAFCKCYEYLKYVSLYALAYHLVLVSGYLVVEAGWPRLAGRLGRPLVVAPLLGVAWAVFFLANIPHAYAHGTMYSPRARKTYCFTANIHDVQNMKHWGVGNFTLLYLLPAVLLVVASVVLVCMTLVGRKGRQQLPESAPSRRDSAITVTLLTLTFIVLWGVPQVQTLLRSLAVVNPHQAILADVGRIFLHGLLPAIVPIILLFGIKKFRQVTPCCRGEGESKADDNMEPRSEKYMAEEVDNPNGDAMKL